MPLYEYLCQSCKKQHEIMQKMSEAPKKKCPECGGKMSKLISSSGFQLKGSGWYKTDYAASGSSSPDTKSTEKKTDSSE